MKNIQRVIGIAVIILPVQAMIRLYADHSNVGLLGWISHDYTTLMIIYACCVVIGGVITALSPRQNSTDDTQS